MSGTQGRPVVTINLIVPDAVSLLGQAADPARVVVPVRLHQRVIEQ
jgi:hypothetical protein